MQGENSTQRPFFESPGILVVRLPPNSPRKHDFGSQLQWDVVDFPGLGTVQVALTLGRSIPNVHRDRHGLRVYFDGYLVENTVARISSSDAHSPARLIAERYRLEGIELAMSLRGSFVAVVLDPANQVAWIFNDRTGSRSVFIGTASDGSLVAAPRISDAVSLLGNDVTLNRCGVAEFLISGSYYSEHTMFEEVQAFPQAGLLDLLCDVDTLATYWRMQYSPPAANPPLESLLDECDAVLMQATKRYLAAASDPVLALSGGLDSRILLACIERAGVREIPCAIYGVTSQDDNDLAIARRVTLEKRLPIAEYIIDANAIASFAADAVWRYDGYVDVLDAPSLDLFWKELGARHSAQLHGDQAFGWYPVARTPGDALRAIGRCNLREVPRLSGWIQRDVRGKLVSEIQSSLDRMISSESKEDPNDLRDRIFFEQCIGIVQNAYAAGRRRSLEQFRPLLDEDVLDFVSRLPVLLRHDKKLLRAYYHRHFGNGSIPIAGAPALPTVADVLKSNARHRNAFALFQKMSAEHLHPWLAEWIDEDAVAKVIDALITDKPLPQVVDAWWQGFPVLAHHHVKRLRSSRHPYIFLRRLTVIDSFLKSLQLVSVR